jgi:MFS family permease
MMPVFTVDVLGVGAEKQGLLMSVGGIGALGVTMLLGARSNFAQKELLIIGGAVVFGVSVAAFALTAQYVGNFYLAMALIVIMGISSSAYMISIMSSLQILVPNDKRGRVMGFYGMTWSIMPLGALWAGVLGDAIDSVPWAIAIGGLLVSGFAVGPALVNKRLRSIGTLLQEAEQGPVDDRRAPDRQTESAPTAGAND